MNLTVQTSNSFDRDDMIYAYRHAQDKLVHQEGHTADGKNTITRYTEHVISTLKKADKAELIRIFDVYNEAQPDAVRLVTSIVLNHLNVDNIDEMLKLYRPD